VIRTELTEAGSRALERCDRAVDEVERELLGDLDADEVTELRDVLSRCGRALKGELAGVSPPA
jgi:DNA-binding MarR family transcriptional regulator